MPMPTEWIRRHAVLWLASCAAFVAAAVPASAATPELPSGVRQSLLESGNVVVSAIAADIDADGDIDVVATDGSLDLLIFVNDGKGQFTRRRPAPRREAHTSAPAPDVERHEPFTDVYRPTAPPPLDADVRAVSFDPSPSSAVARLAADPAIDRAISRRRPRGPPSVPSLI